MKTALIIGGGFAGLTAAMRLRRHKNRFNVVLIDRKERFNFLPMLPDVVSRRVRADFLENSLPELSRRHGVSFVCREAQSVDLVRNRVQAADETWGYDYLLLACGSETNFYGSGQIRQYAYALDNTRDAVRIREAIDRGKYEAFIVAGGGYTGIEIAANVRRRLELLKRPQNITIVEKAPALLGMVAPSLRDYAAENLRRLNIAVLTDTTVEHIDPAGVRLSGSRFREKAMLIWAAGVKTPGLIDRLNVKKTGPGRVVVDDNLRFFDNAFAAGDAASFTSGEIQLRMAVQFSIAQGLIAAENILRMEMNRPLKKYIPVDLGYIVPMANNLSCGIIFGRELKGKLPTLLHYLMCVYRSFGLKNRLGIMCDLAGANKERET